MKLSIAHSKPTIGLKERQAVDKVLRSGFLAQGREAERFETETAHFLGLKGAAAVGSGTKALELTLRALGAGPGREVLIPSYVCAALWHSVIKTGAEPVLVDCEPGGVQMSTEDAARKRTRKTCALILPHLFGEAADIARAKALGIPVIEDCAQSLGASLGGKKLGSFGTACILSFYATKLITTGEGGMVVSSDARLLDKIREWREYDEKKPSGVMENAKMTDLQAALGRVQLKRLPEFLMRREQIARAYDRAFSNLGFALQAVPSPLVGIGRPREHPQIYHAGALGITIKQSAKKRSACSGHAYFRYLLRLRQGNLDRIINYLDRRGVSARRPVFRPLHWDVPCRGKFPHAERAWKECLSLPIYPNLTPKEQERVTQAFKKCVSTENSMVKMVSSPYSCTRTIGA